MERSDVQCDLQVLVCQHDGGVPVVVQPLLADDVLEELQDLHIAGLAQKMNKEFHSGNRKK